MGQLRQDVSRAHPIAASGMIGVLFSSTNQQKAAGLFKFTDRLAKKLDVTSVPIKERREDSLRIANRGKREAQGGASSIDGEIGRAHV